MIIFGKQMCLAEVEKQKIERMKLYKQGKTDQEIAKENNCTASAVRNWRARLGLPRNEVKSTKDDARYALWVNGKTDQEIAQETGFSLSCIQNWRQRKKLLANKPSHNAVDDERCRLWMQGLTDKEIAQKTQYSTAAIAQWRSNRGFSPNHASKRSTNYPKKDKDIVPTATKIMHHYCGNCLHWQDAVSLAARNCTAGEKPVIVEPTHCKECGNKRSNWMEAKP